jgi:hypothetical protein
VKITVSGKSAVSFTNCIFASPAEISVEEAAKLFFVDCRDSLGNPVTPNP